jgi:hypothetical protein
MIIRRTKQPKIVRILIKKDIVLAKEAVVNF